MESPEINPCTMTKEERLQNSRKAVSSTNGTGKTGQLKKKKKDIRSLFNTIHKNKLKMD